MTAHHQARSKPGDGPDEHQPFRRQIQNPRTFGDYEAQRRESVGRRGAWHIGQPIDEKLGYVQSVASNASASERAGQDLRLKPRAFSAGPTNAMANKKFR